MLNKSARQIMVKKLKGIDRINIGCGKDFIKGWLNIGLFLHVEIPYGYIIKQDGAFILNFDVTKRLPIARNTIKYLYASHFIEHLAFEDGIIFLKRCYMMMKKNGIIRLTFPDMELWIKQYYENNIDFFNKYKSFYFPTRDVKTKGEIFMSQVHGSGHKWNYDFESMKDIMKRTGFSNIAKKQAFNSLIPEIRKIEPTEEGRLLETVYVEGKKE